MEISYNFDSVAMKPNKNICSSRLEANITSEVIKGVTRPIPVIGSNMSSVMNADFSIILYNLGALGIMHRAWSNEDDYLQEIKKVAYSCEWTAASIGIDENALSLAKKLVGSGANIICIDVANGYCDAAITLGKKIKEHYKDGVKLIIGNTTNINMMEEVKDFADALKVGVGSNNSVCHTYDVTGFTEGQFSAVLKFKSLKKEDKIPIISDGGIRKPNAFCKAIAAGASSVMLGTVLARCPESAAEFVETPDGLKKFYYGMASRTAQVMWKGGVKQGTCTEGTVKYLDIGESVYNLIERYAGALRSSITYAGGTDIETFQKFVEFIELR